MSEGFTSGPQLQSLYSWSMEPTKPQPLGWRAIPYCVLGVSRALTSSVLPLILGGLGSSPCQHILEVDSAPLGAMACEAALSLSDAAPEAGSSEPLQVGFWDLGKKRANREE